MNRLSTEKRAAIIGCLVEGISIRGTCRITGAAKNTVTKLLVDLGAACADYQDLTLRDLPCTTLEIDEIWAYCYAKQKNVPDEHKGEYGYGDGLDVDRPVRRHEARSVMAGRRAHGGRLLGAHAGPQGATA
jgi:hypothetical protein